MAKKQEPTPERNLDCFYWLPVDKWTVDTTMTLHEIEGKKQCKLCDSWVGRKYQESHVKFHVKEKKVIMARIAAENIAAANEARALKREERRLLKLLENGAK